MSDSELEEDDFIQVLDIEDPVVVETSVAVKRSNFSTFGFIHFKLRNKLSEDRVRKLVYIKTNALQLKGVKANEIDNGDDNNEY
jgi:hypothetical protein